MCFLFVWKCFQIEDKIFIFEHFQRRRYWTKIEQRRMRGGWYFGWLIKDYQGQYFRYILEARKRALAKKKKLRTLGKRTRSADSEDEVEEDGTLYPYIWSWGTLTLIKSCRSPEGRCGQGQEESSHPGGLQAKIQEELRFLGLWEEDQTRHKKSN